MPAPKLVAVRRPLVRGPPPRARAHSPAPPKPARAQALDMLRQIQDMATSKPATQGIRAVPRHRVARRKGVRKYYVRDPEKRDLIISLSGGHCENSSCKDNGYLTDVTADGQPLLEVDHVIPLGRGGLDDPFNMIALCANCHDRKTRGSTAKLLTLQFKNMIGPKRRRQIHG
jgi:5-methylcytosine-specific restriction endonuclease McrA